MDGKIDSDGYILIKRKNNYKHVECHKKSQINKQLCGDSCVMFAEPFVSPMYGSVTLQICSKEFFFKNFEDERE